MSTMSMQYHGLDTNTYCPHCGELISVPTVNFPPPNISTFERRCTKCGEKYDANAFCPSCCSDQLLIEEESKKIRKDVKNSTALENFILDYDEEERKKK